MGLSGHKAPGGPLMLSMASGTVERKYAILTVFLQSRKRDSCQQKVPTADDAMASIALIGTSWIGATANSYHAGLSFHAELR